MRPYNLGRRHERLRHIQSGPDRRGSRAGADARHRRERRHRRPDTAAGLGGLRRRLRMRHGPRAPRLRPAGGAHHRAGADPPARDRPRGAHRFAVRQPRRPRQLRRRLRAGSARTAYPAEVRARFDIVGMDPRGVGASTPVRCFADADAQQAFFADYNVLPIGRAEQAAAVRKAADFGARCQARVGWLLPHLSTANVARDLDLMRAAVGDRTLSYVGYSYGTYLGATYANLFPGKVRVLALDANTDPPAYADGPRDTVPFGRVERAAGGQRNARPVLRAVRGRPARGARSPPRATRVRRTQHWRSGCAPTRCRFPTAPSVGYAQLVDVTLAELYNPAGWAGAASILQQLYDATEQRHRRRRPTTTSRHTRRRTSTSARRCSPASAARPATRRTRSRTPTSRPGPTARHRTSAPSGRTSPCRARPGRPATPTATPDRGGSARRTRRLS